MERREFLKGSAVVATAPLIPNLLSGCLGPGDCGSFEEVGLGPAIKRPQQFKGECISVQGYAEAKAWGNEEPSIREYALRKKPQKDLPYLVVEDWGSKIIRDEEQRVEAIGRMKQREATENFFLEADEVYPV